MPANCAVLRGPLTLTAVVLFALLAWSHPRETPAVLAAAPPETPQATEATVPLTVPEGLTVKVPSNWRVSQLGNAVTARAPDNFSYFQYGNGGDAALSMLAQAEADPQFQQVQNGDARFLYVTNGGGAGGTLYTIVVAHGGRAAVFQCRETPEVVAGSGGCLAIARSARIAAATPPAGTSVAAAPPPAQAVETGFDGAWGGTLDANGTKLRLSLRLAKGSGTIVSIDQGNATFPVSGVTQAGTRLVFNVPSISASFAGDLQDGQITGTWTQGLAALPLTFARTASSPVSTAASGSVAGAQPPVAPVAPSRPPVPQPAKPDAQPTPPPDPAPTSAAGVPAAAPRVGVTHPDNRVAGSSPGEPTAKQSAVNLKMMALASPDGFTVDVPDDWTVTTTPVAANAHAPDGYHLGNVRLEARDARLQVENAERNPKMFTSVGHPSGRLYYRRTDSAPMGALYSILVSIGERAAYFTCFEAAGTADTPAGCLNVARTARFAGSPAEPTVSSSPTSRVQAAPPTSSRTGNAGTSPLNSPFGFTVDVPADWQGAGGSSGLQATSTSGAVFRYQAAGHSACEQFERAAQDSTYTRIAHDSGELLVRETFPQQGIAAYTGIARFGRVATSFICRERVGGNDPAGDCLAIARSIRVSDTRAAAAALCGR